VFGKIGAGYIPPENRMAGQGSHNSMPSSHAANWFCGAMVLLLFYRRSAWLMLPLALGVSFSRLYNGVHYPSDVLAGAIIGAGYAVAAAIAIEAACSSLAKNIFRAGMKMCRCLCRICIGQTSQAADHGRDENYFSRPRL